MSSKKEISVLIADDHPGWIEGIRSILHIASDMRVVGEAQNGDQIRQKVAELHPDVKKHAKSKAYFGSIDHTSVCDSNMKDFLI